MISAPVAATNQARAYKHITVNPYAASLGAEVLDVDVANLSPEQVVEIKQALTDHQVVFFRDQDISVEDQERFTLNFGEYGVDPFVPGLKDHPHVLHLLKEADEATGYVFGGAWHSDWSFQETPPAFTILYGSDIPPYGGDTLFANLYQAYDNLSPTMKQVCEGLQAVHSAERGYGPAMKAVHDLYENMEVINSEEALKTYCHPMVRTHPVTGKKALYISESYTVGILGMHMDEANVLLNFLNQQNVDHMATVRFRWKKGSIAMWDNRCTLHKPMGDYLGVRREMFRTTVAGEKPVFIND